MTEPRGSYKRYDEPRSAKRSGLIVPIGLPEIEISAWCPDHKAELPPEQVHMTFIVPTDKGNINLVARYKSPETLGFIIEELARYRKLVWKDAPPLDISGEIK